MHLLPECKVKYFTFLRCIIRANFGLVNIMIMVKLQSMYKMLQVGAIFGFSFYCHELIKRKISKCSVSIDAFLLPDYLILSLYHYFLPFRCNNALLGKAFFILYHSIKLFKSTQLKNGIV